MALENFGDGAEDAIADEAVGAKPVLGALRRFKVKGYFFLAHCVCEIIIVIVVEALVVSVVGWRDGGVQKRDNARWATREAGKAAGKTIASLGA